MRCFFMKRGRICSVEYLAGETDQELIQKAQEAFQTKGLSIGADGFEVWDRTRFIYRFASEGTEQSRPVADGLKGPPGLLQRIIRRWTLKFSHGAQAAAAVMAGRHLLRVIAN